MTLHTEYGYALMIVAELPEDLIFQGSLYAPGTKLEFRRLEDGRFQLVKVNQESVRVSKTKNPPVSGFLLKTMVLFGWFKEGSWREDLSYNTH